MLAQIDSRQNYRLLSCGNLFVDCGLTLHRSFSCTQHQYYWDNIAQVKTLCNVVLEAPDNSTHEKILFNVVLIHSRQHCTGQNPMYCCPRGSRQQCIRKILVQCCLNTLGTILHRSKPYEMLPERLQTTLHRKKPVQCCLNTPGTTLHR